MISWKAAGQGANQKEASLFGGRSLSKQSPPETVYPCSAEERRPIRVQVHTASSSCSDVVGGGPTCRQMSSRGDPGSCFTFLFSLSDPPVVQQLRRTFKYFKDYRQVILQTSFPPGTFHSDMFSVRPLGGRVRAEGL